MDIIIRKPNINEFNDVSDLLLEVHKLHVTLRPDIYKDAIDIITIDDYINKINSDCMFIAEYNGEIIGLMEIMYREETRDFFVKRKVVFIDTLVVKDKYKRKGVCTSLLNYLITIKKEKQLDSIELQVNAKNIDAYNVYRRLGFKDKSINMELL